MSRIAGPRPAVVRLVMASLTFLPAAALSAQQRNPTLGVAAPKAADARPRGVIDGFVTDTSLIPIGAAEVSVLRANLHLFTNRAGRFRITDVTPGHYVLIVRRLGFRPISQVIEVLPNDTMNLSYTLEPGPRVALDTVRVTATRMTRDLQEFEERRARGLGEFLTREQIERRGSVELPTLMRGFRGVALASDPTKGKGVTEEIAYNRRDFGNFLSSGAGACPMQVFIDGTPMPRAFDLSLGPLPSEIAGIEVYGGPSSAPARFSGADRSCGMILIWTRVVR